MEERIEKPVMLKDLSRKQLFDYYNKLLLEINLLDAYIMTNTGFRYMKYFEQVLLKHKVVIMEISRHRLLKYLKQRVQSI